MDKHFDELLAITPDLIKIDPHLALRGPLLGARKGPGEYFANPAHFKKALRKARRSGVVWETLL